MKKLVIAALVLILLLITTALASYMWWNQATAAPDNLNNPKRVVIKKGTSAEEIASELQKQGVIRDALAFKIYTQIRDLAGRIQAGEFTLPTNAALTEVVTLLLAGPKEVWVTIPEGLRREQVAEKFADTFVLERNQATAFRQEFLQLTTEAEGYLFPDTYLFAKIASPSAVINKMKGTFTQKTKELSVTPQIVIMASILERETKTAEEAPIVAGILNNRLRVGMPLQADATVQYALGNINCRALDDDCDWWKTPTREDLEINSVFNTYKINGLPPFPIASPGLAMLQAAANPEDTDYFYYIHDSKGQIYYARTLEEHNQNIARYLN